jgi:hypothetical protein
MSLLPTARRPLTAARSPLATAERSALRPARRGPTSLAALPGTGPEIRPGHDLVMRPTAGVHTGLSAGAALLDGAGPALRSERAVGARGAARLGVASDRRAAPAHPGSRSEVPPATGPGGNRMAPRGPETTHRTATSLVAQHTARPLPSRPAAGQPITRPAEPLVTRPAAGPDIHNPQPAEYLRVLGAATLPPGSEPDPSGAVTLSPAAAPRPGRAARPGRSGGDSVVPVSKKASPRQRWESAVAQRPLEAPRSLPTALHAMASALAGRARPPLYTTGPATRNALAAAGALGATTGTVVHLPSVPRAAMSPVLAHELMHTRSPVRRPRFFLDGVSGLLDDDERKALDAGRRQASTIGGGLLDAGRSTLAEAAPTAAGIVDRLPVGGGLGAIGEVATRAAKAAVLEAAAGPMGTAQGFADNAQQTATGALSSASGTTPAVSGLTDAASSAVGSVAAAASGVVDQATSAANGSTDAARHLLDPDKIMDIVEARLLREIERRGGRWAGMF